MDPYAKSTAGKFFFSQKIFFQETQFWDSGDFKATEDCAKCTATGGLDLWEPWTMRPKRRVWPFDGLVNRSGKMTQEKLTKSTAKGRTWKILRSSTLFKADRRTTRWDQTVSHSIDFYHLLATYQSLILIQKTCHCVHPAMFDSYPGHLERFQDRRRSNLIAAHCIEKM